MRQKRRVPRDEAIDFDALYRRCGSARRVAAALGIVPGTLTGWKTDAGAIPVHHAMRIHQLFDVPLHEIRPDIWEEGARLPVPKPRDTELAPAREKGGPTKAKPAAKKAGKGAAKRKQKPPSPAPEEAAPRLLRPRDRAA